MFLLKFMLLNLYIVLSLPTRAQDTETYFSGSIPAKEVVIPAYRDFQPPSAVADVSISIDIADTLAPVSTLIYGNNANTYMTQMVDQPQLLEYIEHLNPHLIRYPGGNLSSLFFWNAAQGELPDDAPALLYNAEGVEEEPYYWQGMNADSWTLSVDNYYKMLEMTNSSGVITVNYGYARYGLSEDPVAQAAHLAADWVRYDNGRTRFWEIGNESNGEWQAGYKIDTDQNQDGQPEIVSGALYGEHFLVFADSMRAAAVEIGHEIQIGGQLIQFPSDEAYNEVDRNWNDGFFQSAGNAADYFIVHSYYTPYNENSTVETILNSAEKETAKMMDWMKETSTKNSVDMKPIALTEWNIFAVGSKQQVSYINGMHAAKNLGELIKHKYALATRWDLANAYDNGDDHGMFNNGDEPDVPQWNPRPVYYYMYYFQQTFGDHLVASSVSGSEDMITYASAFQSGEAGIVVINEGEQEHTVKIDLQNFGYGDRYYLYSLTGGDDKGTFSGKVFVNGEGTAYASGGPADVTEVEALSAQTTYGVKFEAPPRSVHYILVESGDRQPLATQDEIRDDIRIYPVPAQNKINIKLEKPAYQSLELVDARGRIVMGQDIKSGDTQVEIETNLPSGIYLLKLYRKDGEVNVKRLMLK